MTIAHTHSGGAPEPKLSRSFPMLCQNLVPPWLLSTQDRRRTKNKSFENLPLRNHQGRKKKGPPSFRPKKICPTCKRSHESVKFHGEACWLSIPANPYRIHGNITNPNKCHSDNFRGNPSNKKKTRFAYCLFDAPEKWVPTS